MICTGMQRTEYATLEEQLTGGGSVVVVLDVSNNILAKKASHTLAHARHLGKQAEAHKRKMESSSNVEFVYK